MKLARYSGTGASMSDFVNIASSGSLSVKLWRGERMCLVGMDVAAVEDDFVGFSIEVKGPGASEYVPLLNRLNFDYLPGGPGVNGFRNYSSLVAPFQKFRWIHFPPDPRDGDYLYRVTEMHMNAGGTLRAGDQVANLNMRLDQVTYDDYLDVGFTRNFASSQAFAEKYHNNPNVIPQKADEGLQFQKIAGDVYQWLGFEAHDLIFGMLNEVHDDPRLSIDVFAYDFNEPDILAKLEGCGDRVRAVIDNSGDHAAATSAETQAASRLAHSAGANAVRRMHFANLQHNKVFIVRRDGAPQKVLFGSTNFSFRGLYIQANNVLVFYASAAAGLFGHAFDLAFAGGAAFADDALSAQRHLVQTAGKPVAHFCFSPHHASDLSLSPVGAAIDQASSSVFFAIAFLNQIKSGPTRGAIDRLTQKKLFSYGIVNCGTGLEIKKRAG
jgi:hypothetical protein